MFKRLAALLVVVLSLGLVSCTASTLGGLTSYVNSASGYEFLYPVGWVGVSVSEGPEVVFRDLIEETENVSVVVNPVSGDQSLTDLGSPGDVGYRLLKAAIAPPDSDRKAELVMADSHELNGKLYYTLEYTVKLPNQDRHNLASIAVSRGKLYTFNASTTEQRWPRVKPIFEEIVNSFSVR